MIFMNKANKYKYKYVELKKRIEYNDGGVYNGVGGGCFSGFLCNKKDWKAKQAETNVKIKKVMIN